MVYSYTNKRMTEFAGLLLVQIRHSKIWRFASQEEIKSVFFLGGWSDVAPLLAQHTGATLGGTSGTKSNVLSGIRGKCGVGALVRLNRTAKQ